MDTSFADLTEFRQTLFVDELKSSGHHWSTIHDLEKAINEMLNGAKNDYVKISVLKFLGDCAITDQLSSSYFALGIYSHEVEDNNDPLVLSCIIRYQAILTPPDDTTFYEKLRAHSNSLYGDISSEALYWLGMLEFPKLQSSALKDVFEVLENAEKFFRSSYQATENRVDALYNLLLIDYLRCAATKDFDGASKYFNSLTLLILDRMLLSLNDNRNEEDSITYEILSIFHKIFSKLSEVNQWLDFRTELCSLLEFNSRIEKIFSLLAREGIVYKNFIRSLLHQVRAGIEADGLCNETARLNRLRDIPGIHHLIERLSKVADQKGSQQRNPELMGVLSKLHADPNTAFTRYDELVRIPDQQILLRELRKEVEKSIPKNNVEFKSGSPQGQEVWTYLKNEINSHLPDLKEEKVKVFLSILEELIRYAHFTIVGSAKADFPFLYAPNYGGKGKGATEGDLQNHVFDYLKRGRLAYGLEHEKAKFSDGGRVDIVFSQDALTFPIEIKKSFDYPTETSIKQDYIAQAQTYTAAYDQLGVCMILDLSDKELESTVGFRDWFGFHNFTSIHKNLKHPDYVVSIIIPGNKVLPSSKSHYARR